MASNTRVLRVVIAGDGKGAEKAFDAVARKSLSFGKTLATVGGAVTFGLAARKVYELGSNLEQNLNILEQLSSVNGVVTKTAQDYNKALQEQAGSFTRLGFSTGEASGALVELVKAGVGANDATKALYSTLVLARGGGLELADAATAISNSLNVFKGSGLTAADAANILANAANLSSANAGNLLESLQQASAVASQANLSFAETNALLAIFANNGIKGSDAGTTLKTMLNRLRVGVEGSKEAMKQLGISAYDSAGNMRKITDIIADLDRATSKLSDKDKADAFYKIFGSDAIRSGTIATKEGAKSLAEFIAAVQQGGTAEAVAAARTKGFSGAVKQAASAAKTGAEQLYMALAPSLETVARSFMDVAKDAIPSLKKSFDDALPKIKDFADKAAAGIKTFYQQFKDGTGTGWAVRSALASIGQAVVKVAGVIAILIPYGIMLAKSLIPVVTIAGQIVGHLADFVKWALSSSAGATALRYTVVALGLAFGAFKIVGLIQAFMRFGGVLKVFRLAVMAVRGAMLFLNLAIRLNPIGILVSALTLAIVGLVYAYRHSERFRSIINALGEVFKRFGAAVGAILAGIATGVIMLAKLMLNAFLLQFTLITQGAAKAFGWIPGIGGKIKAAAEKFSEFKDKANAALDSASAHAQGLAQNLAEVAQDRTARITVQVRTVYTNADTINEQEDEKAAQRKARTQAGRAPGAAAYNPREVAPRPSISGSFGTPGLNPASSFDSSGGGGSSAKKKAESAAKKAANQAKAFAQSIGKWLVDGYLKGFTASRAALSKAVEGVRNSILKLDYVPAAKKSRALAVLADSNKKLMGLVDRRVAVVNKLKAAEKQLASLKAAKAELAGKVKDKLLDGMGLGAAFSAEDNADNSSAGILDRLRKQAAAAAQFGQQLKDLTRLGLNSTSLQQIIDAGVDQGGQLASALLGGGTGAIAEVNAITKQMNDQASKLGNSVASQMYDAGIRSAQGLVDGLKKEQSKIEQLMVQIAKGMTAAIKAALGIKSPSRVMAALGKYVPEGFALGITAGIGDVESAMDAIGAVRPSGGSSGAAMAAGSGNVNVTVNVTVQGSVKAEKDLAKSIATEVRNEIARKARPNGGRTGV